MKSKSRRPMILILGFILILGGISVYNAGAEYYFEGNVRQFSLLSIVQDTQRMDCDAFNQISVTYDDGVYKTLADGKTGLAPFIDDGSSILGRTTNNIQTDDLARFTSLDLTSKGVGIDKVHFEVALECNGTAMNGDTLVDGMIMTRICGDPAKGGTTCILGNEKRGIEFAPVTFSPVNLNAGEKKVIQSSTFDEAQIIDTFSKFGTIFFKQETYPVLDFSFDHETAGTFTAEYDAFSQNDKIIAQFGLIENADPTGKDKGGGQKNPDTAGKGLRVNWWTPQILDLANNEKTISLSVGIENLSEKEITPSIKLRNLDGFLKEEFNLPAECISNTLGWNDCETTVTLDIERYPIGSYKLEVSSDSRLDETNSVSIEIVDMTIPPPPEPDDIDGDGILDSVDLCPTDPENYNGFQDEDGCPDILPPPPPEPEDRDGDGILDNVDQCPDEAETPNGFEDEDGCPDEKPAPPPSGGGGGSGGGSGGSFSNIIEDTFTETTITDSGVTITRSHSPQILSFADGIDNQVAVMMIAGGSVAVAVVVGRFV